MGLKSISVVPYCSKHGTVDRIAIGSSHYCAKCFDDALHRMGVTRVSMVTIRQRTEGITITCYHCGSERADDDRVCGACGQ